MTTEQLQFRRVRQTTVSITPEEAETLKDERVAFHTAYLQQVLTELKSAVEDLQTVTDEPLLTEKTIREDVFPGEPGYDELPPIYEVNQATS